LFTERARYFEAKVEDKFRVLFEISKILDKKIANNVLKKIAEVDQKITVGLLSEGHMAATCELVKEVELKIRKYELKVREY
jgi:hypothetical protein